LWHRRLADLHLPLNLRPRRLDLWSWFALRLWLLAPSYSFATRLRLCASFALRLLHLRLSLSLPSLLHYLALGPLLFNLLSSLLLLQLAHLLSRFSIAARGLSREPIDLLPARCIDISRGLLLSTHIFAFAFQLQFLLPDSFRKWLHAQ
jgi:hypothetical protein